MKRFFLIPMLSLLLSCITKEPKFIRKRIEYKDITIRWFYYSYETNTSPDYIVVEKNGNSKEIYKAEWVISDVLLKEHDIILKLVTPSKGIVYTKQVEKEVFGYKIIIDTTASYNALRIRPDGVKEKK